MILLCIVNFGGKECYVRNCRRIVCEYLFYQTRIWKPEAVAKSQEDSVTLTTPIHAYILWSRPLAVHYDIPLGDISHLPQSAVTGGYLRDEVDREASYTTMMEKWVLRLLKSLCVRSQFWWLFFLTTSALLLIIFFKLRIWTLVGYSLRGAGCDLYFVERDDIIVAVEPQGRVYTYIWRRCCLI
jgi:hypothetical protein